MTAGVAGSCLVGAGWSMGDRAVQTVPIVIAFSGDPVGIGMVSSLTRPEANLTGVSLMSSDLAAKRLELLKQTVPRMTRLAVLYTPGRTLGVTMQPLEGEQPEDLERLFVAAGQGGSIPGVRSARIEASDERRDLLGARGVFAGQVISAYLGQNPKESR